MQKQVDKSHYDFAKYVHKSRWVSMWHQLDEVIKFNPERVLEVGPGPGVFKAVATTLGLNVETLDIAPDLKPDNIASVFEMPFEDHTFDVVCAFQMLEHLPFEKSLEAFREMARVASDAVVISLPDAAIRWPMAIYVPKIGVIKFSVPRPRLRSPVHKFNGEHHWEINKVGYSLDYVLSELGNNATVSLVTTYRVPENPYHRFFVYKKLSQSQTK